MALRRFFARREQAKTLKDVRWDVKGVEVGLQELGIYGETLLFGLLDVFKHTEGQLPLHFFRAAGVQSSIEGHD